MADQEDEAAFLDEYNRIDSTQPSKSTKNEVEKKLQSRWHIADVIEAKFYRMGSELPRKLSLLTYAGRS